VQHCSPEQLSLAALSEPLPDDDAGHLAACATCRAEVASLRRGVEALAVPEFAAPGAGVPPPPSVWSAVAAATGVASAPRPEAMRTEPERPDAPAAVPAGSAEPAEPAAPPAGRVTPLHRRPRPRLLLAVAAAVVGVVVGGGAVALLQRTDQGTQIAAAPLDPLQGHRASGRAEVVERDGRRLLEVQLRAPGLNGAYYEVWLAERSLAQMVPLGIAQPGTVTFELPTGLDLGRYPVVDVSIEPLDGDPAHSADSLARGELGS
jgi:Anti-sigma-K factor rskA